MLQHKVKGGCKIEIHDSFKRDFTQISSAVTKANDMYSTTVLLLETTFFFLDFHETKFSPKKTQLRKGLHFVQRKTIRRGPFKIPQNPFDNKAISINGCCHKLIQFINTK